MVSFFVYDLIFLVAFTLAVAIFLYTRKHNLQRQGLLYLYRTRVGIRFIDWFSKRFSTILKPSQYVAVASGYILMLFMVVFLIRFTIFYLTSPFAAQALKVPILLPLVPYLPKLFNISFLPPFYFIYWIIIIAIIAIPHEFAHGIYARLNKTKIHSTGFGFLGPFLAAFVEPDERQMSKLSKFKQLSILAGGTFANVLVTIFFVLIIWVFFSFSFVAAGVNFNAYSTSQINTSDIEFINGIPIDEIESIEFSTDFINITVNGNNFQTTPISIINSLDLGLQTTVVFDNSPAFNVRLPSPILEIDGEKITSLDELTAFLSSKNPGDAATIKTLSEEGEVEEYEIIFDERNGKAFLGIGFAAQPSSGIVGTLFTLVGKVKDPRIYYESPLGDFGVFIYDFLWWTIMVSLSVARGNMIPVGIFEGGGVFVLTGGGLTGSEKLGRRAYNFSTWAVIIIVILLMAKWFIAVA